MNSYFFGIDVGTQGVRIVLVDQKGNVLSSGARKFVLNEKFREVQSPDLWWENCVLIMDKILAGLPQSFDKTSIMAISVTSTSGTVIPLDKNNKPLHPAIMYSDGRSAEQGKRIKELAQRHVLDGYTGFNASSGISKILNRKRI
jgi:sugar (pentulose or hexulose) kinase